MFATTTKRLLSPVLMASFLLLLYCTPKTGSKIATTPVTPAEPAYDTIGKPLMGEAEGEEPITYNFEEGAEVSAANLDTLPVYNASHTFEHDLVHTKIDISFDWAKKRANAKATLTLHPWFYPTDKLTLDAKNFDIQSVTFEGKTDQLKYTYNNEQLVINLGRTFTRTEEFKVTIGYTAKPEERDSFGGSAAISGDKGLYFINPDGADPDKPKQIWTQGETESNSRWFPTVDKPNERCTGEIAITVEDKYKTLSNGILTGSKKNADGTRTDSWKMDKPIAPYLYMMAVGEFAVVKDKWRGIDVDYYVEPKYEAYAKDIYPYTTEMLEFFSNKLNYAYPWQKFSQIIVRDYVSGAMENVTAVIFGDFMQKTKRELLDDHLTNEKVVAHEMFHHWFGDLVTTESWANLTLNEGFANYSEYLWMEYKHGRDAAEEHEKTEREGYLGSAADGGHPLIHFGYGDREEMFDAHSYNKGGAVLHMLRNQVGDDAFFTALSRYLKRNEYTDVEAHELRLMFEDVTGQDLSWFWNQWFYQAGHPVLDISYGWDEEKKKASVHITQTQEGEKVPHVFDLPLAVDVYDAAGKARRENIRVTKREQTFYFDAPTRPALVNVDAVKTLLCVKNDQHTPAEWAFMYQHAPLFLDRYEALTALQEDDSPETAAVFAAALNDPYFGIRAMAIQRTNPAEPAGRTAIARMAETETEPSLRALAISFLGQTGDKMYVPVIKKGLDSSLAYSVNGAALGALVELDPDAAMEASKVLQNDESDAIVLTLTELYTHKPDASQLPYFESKMPKVDFMGAFSFFDSYQKVLTGIGDEALIDRGIANMKAISTNLQTSPWRRFGSTKAIADIRGYFKEKGNTAKVEAIGKIIAEIKSIETDSTLKLYYDMF